ncbi:glycoside hydrolase family 10 protein [Sphaerobolus stellatus SS14]|nr:glycoside hydrolase family 10 protein [Sphaerobolus stellatus SS14]
MFAQQAQDYLSVVSACAAVKRCVSVTTWGIMDNHSWIVGKDVLPWTGTGEAKPAATAIVQAFEAAK